MALGIGQASDADAAQIGAFYDALIRDGAWIRRRVETIQMLDEGRTEHRVTLDIDNQALSATAAKFGVPLSDIVVPLENLTKELQFDLDVRNVDGVPMPVTLSSEDSHSAHALLLATVSRHGIALGAIPTAVREQLFDIVRRPSIDLFLEIANRVTVPNYERNPAFGFALDGPAVRCWQALLFIDEVFDRILQASQNYLLSTRIEKLVGDVTILKFRYVEVGDTAGRLFWRQRLGFGAPRIFLPISGVGTAQREHTRVVAPEGSTIARVRLAYEDTELELSTYGRRESAERAAIYTRGLERGFYGVVLDIVPRLGSFFVPAVLCTLFFALLLGFGTYFEVVDGRFTRGSANADAAVAMLALVPSLLTVYFVRQGEHRIVARLLSLPRILVLFAAVTAILVAGGVAADIPHDSLAFVMVLALSTNVLVSAYLLAAIAATSIRVGQPRASTFPDD